MSEAPLPPSGAQVTLRYGEDRAVLTEVGATLRELVVGGRPLVAGFGEHDLRPVYRGALLAPWPNRVRSGAYRFGGQEHQLALNEVDRGNALHGLVQWTSWSVRAADDASATLGCRVVPQQGYPFALDLRLTCRLDEAGLTSTLTAVNTGDRDAPYGAGAHPYLLAPAGRLESWTLEVPAERYLTVDDRLLPTGEAPVEGTDLDFRGGRQIGDAVVDHALTGLPAGGGSARLLDEDGRGTSLSWGPECRWIQVHTADRPEPELHRSSMVVEPMTCPPDAYNSGQDLVVLAPGQEHALTWVVAAV